MKEIVIKISYQLKFSFPFLRNTSTEHTPCASRPRLVDEDEQAGHHPTLRHVLPRTLSAQTSAIGARKPQQGTGQGDKAVLPANHKVPTFSLV